MDGGDIFGGFLAVAAAAVLAFFLLRGRELAPAEANLTPLMSTFCWVSLGNLGFWAHGNFRVRLAIYPDFFVLGFSSPVVIRFSEIANIELRENFLSGRQLCINTAAGISYRLAVKHPDEVAKLLRTGGGSTDKQSAWTCSKCREENPLEFELCWKCQTAK
jgi:hypothetical protein